MAIYTTTITVGGKNQTVAWLSATKYVKYYQLDISSIRDLDALVALNGGTLPLSDYNLVYVLGANGRSWYDTYASFIVDQDAAPTPTPTPTSSDGTDATGVVAPSGGSGVRGWLSGIFNAVSGVLKTSSSITASDATTFDPDSLAQTLAYNADGTLNYIQVVSAGNTYRQTFTYASGVITGISAWEKQ